MKTASMEESLRKWTSSRRRLNCKRRGQRQLMLVCCAHNTNTPLQLSSENLPPSSAFPPCHSPHHLRTFLLVCRRNWCGEWQWGKAELGGRFSDESCNGVFVLCAQHTNINCRCPRRLQLSLRLLDVHFRSDSSMEAVFIQF